MLIKKNLHSRKHPSATYQPTRVATNTVAPHHKILETFSICQTDIKDGIEAKRGHVIGIAMFLSLPSGPSRPYRPPRAPLRRPSYLGVVIMFIFPSILPYHPCGNIFRGMKVLYVGHIAWWCYVIGRSVYTACRGNRYGHEVYETEVGVQGITTWKKLLRKCCIIRVNGEISPSNQELPE